MIQLIQNYKALGSDRRVLILRYLHSDPKTVQEIAKMLSVTSPAASFHLRKLYREGYVRIRRRGKNSYYFIPQHLLSSRWYARFLAESE